MKNLTEPHRTAIQRNKLSAPMKLLEEDGQLDGRVLDYGCGRGFDAKALELELYDPYFFPDVPDGKFDTITCNYVLNVVDEETEAWIISDIESKLEDGGHAFITVRRDLNGSESTQRVVRLDLPVYFENNSFCIYETWV